MSRTTRLGIRASLAALAIAGAAAAPLAAFADATHPANTTISADPSDVDYYFVGDTGAGGGGGG
ncbi:hypothetical protein AWB91_02330 [Mycobacterium paraense]|uniref:Uncharacterized protein n=1 Tax=Mycobacterium paraense TaxID=767916 RepID=A0ABX3VGS5_9MYCO|nr:hypothetical protein [Mycobacterium paraense]ORW28070.1 hypothetical protein AWB91_02330 [Mycobacterium paraense]ORW42565.1 hypothetical protein AWB88_00465 [Mycobacterium paraense]